MDTILIITILVVVWIICIALSCFYVQKRCEVIDADPENYTWLCIVPIINFIPAAKGIRMMFRAAWNF